MLTIETDQTASVQYTQQWDFAKRRQLYDKKSHGQLHHYLAIAEQHTWCVNATQEDSSKDYAAHLQQN